MYKPIVFLFLFFILTGCFIADELVYNKSEYTGSLSTKVKNAISIYIKTEYKEYSYYKYGFSNLIIHKPTELVERDSLLNVKAKTNEQKTNLENKIDSLNLVIKQNNIKYWMEMDHFFNVKNKNSNQIELYEATFYLNDSLQVINTKPLLFLELTKNEEDVFSSFFFESPIFYAETFYESQKISRDFYEFFKVELENRKGITKKSKFLKHIIWVCGQVKTTKAFNLESILSQLTINNFLNNQQIKDYKTLKFSKVFEIKEDNVLKNYYFFHKFSHSKNDTIIESAVYVGFSPYYELTDIYQLNEPIEPYFNEKND